MHITTACTGDLHCAQIAALRAQFRRVMLGPLYRFSRNKMEISFDKEGHCLVQDSGGRRITSFSTIYSRAYNRTNRFVLSRKLGRIYIPNWERGLFCYDINNGVLVWKQGPGKVGTVEVVDDSLVIKMVERGIYVRDIEDGALANEKKMSGIRTFIRVSERELFAGPYRNKYFLFNIPDLEVKAEIPVSHINPSNCLSFIITDCTKDGGKLKVEGWEEYCDREESEQRLYFYDREITI